MKYLFLAYMLTQIEIIQSAKWSFNETRAGMPEINQ